MEDRRLIHQCQHGSQNAFCRLYEKYRELLFRIAVSLVHDGHLAEDIVHDVFVTFAEKMGDFRLTGSLKAYLSVCVVNRAKNVLRRHVPGKHYSENDCLNASETPAAEAPPERLACNEQMLQLAAAMEQLPFEQRQIIALRHHGDMRFGHIAQSLDLSINTVKSRYRYGIDKLRTLLNEKEES